MPASLLPYRKFIQEIDSLCERLVSIHRSYLSCRKGCYACCTDISVLAVEAFAIRRSVGDSLKGIPEEEEASEEAKSPMEKKTQAREKSPAEGRTPADKGTPLDKNNQEQDPPSSPCVFLDKEGACTIYPYRPLICRTHGLPILYPILEYDEAGRQRKSEEPQWQLFYCDLNFQGLKDEDMERVFQPESVLHMEEWNQQLVLINEVFRGSADGVSFLKAVYQGELGEKARKELFHTGRIPLSSLGWAIL